MPSQAVPESRKQTIELSDDSPGTFEATRRLPESEDEDDEQEGDFEAVTDSREGAELPVSHEVVMKDHHKVCLLPRALPSFR